jgi:hypothetical protein
MNAQREIEKRIKQKEEEVRTLERQIDQAKAYVDALKDSLKFISKSSDSNTIDAVRPGSMIDKARRVIQKAGHPLHIDKILVEIGKENTKKNKSSLSGSLGQYVRQGIIFIRTGPNIFSLKELEDQTREELPDDFGQN